MKNEQRMSSLRAKDVEMMLLLCCEFVDTKQKFEALTPNLQQTYKSICKYSHMFTVKDGQCVYTPLGEPLLALGKQVNVSVKSKGCRYLLCDIASLYLGFTLAVYDVRIVDIEEIYASYDEKLYDRLLLDSTMSIMTQMDIISFDQKTQQIAITEKGALMVTRTFDNPLDTMYGNILAKHMQVVVGMLIASHNGKDALKQYITSSGKTYSDLYSITNALVSLGLVVFADDDRSFVYTEKGESFLREFAPKPAKLEHN